MWYSIYVQCLVFEEKNEPFLLDSILNLTYEILYDNVNKIILLISLI